MGGGGGGRGWYFKFSVQKNKFENNGKNIKAQDSPAEGGLYIHNLVIRGAWNIMCVHIPAMNRAY